MPGTCALLRLCLLHISFHKSQLINQVQGSIPVDPLGATRIPPFPQYERVALPSTDDEGKLFLPMHSHFSLPADPWYQSPKSPAISCSLQFSGTQSFSPSTRTYNLADTKIVQTETENPPV